MSDVCFNMSVFYVHDSKGTADNKESLKLKRPAVHRSSSPNREAIGRSLRQTRENEHCFKHKVSLFVHTLYLTRLSASHLLLRSK